MLDAFDRDVVAENPAKHIPFRAADAGARGGGFADGAVVLDEQEPVGSLTHDLGHVPLVGAQARECACTNAERCVGPGDSLLIRVDLRVRPRVDDAAEAVFADRAADGVDELDAQLRMVVGEQRPGRVAERPRGGWPAPARGGPGRVGHKACGFERGEVLADGDVGEPQCVGQRPGRGGTGALELVEQAALGCADAPDHECRIGRCRGFPKALP